MPHLNIEIKARCSDPKAMERILQKHNAEFKGIDHQIDTYFRAPKGRLKLREGNIENTLIHYHRPNQAGPKRSEVFLYYPNPDSAIKPVLEAAMGILVIVDKKRAISFIDNVKFHIDKVQQLGSFVEIEAIDYDGNIGEAKLLEQCRYYMKLLGIDDQDLIDISYSDMLLKH